MKKWLALLLISSLYGCGTGPSEKDIQQHATAQLLAQTEPGLFDVSDITVLATEQPIEGAYLIKIGYQLHFNLGLTQLQALQHEDLTYDQQGPFQQALDLMDLDHKYGEFTAGQVLAQQSSIWLMKSDQGWQLAEPAI
ncbi:hypothetical protein [Aeromonas cavernicola]|uniref:Uncharacterized protein n=1 Tax=Aeromonas cavernicola TaxID=1006623 RepID=A0A2H9U6Q8_9GAMM|nr:hypothetical protein [Aeromonas cavernicola]PJG59668.1 hypothetical protein CUC53_06180 [Aeromonas cavernicola]